MRTIIYRDEAHELDDAHSEGWHEEAPREGCPSCDRRELSSYPVRPLIKRRLSPTERDILRWTEQNGNHTCVGIISVLAARQLASYGLVTMISDDADKAGIGQCKTGPPATAAA